MHDFKESNMNSKAGQHNQEHVDLVFLYALRTLPESETPAAEAQVFACAGCREELETLRPIIGSFVFWPADVLRPDASLWGRLAQRIAEEVGKPPFRPPLQAPAKPEWKKVVPGI